MSESAENIEKLLNECWERENEKVAMSNEDLLHPTPSYQRRTSIEEEICSRRLGVHTAVYFFESADVLRHVLSTKQGTRSASERVDKYIPKTKVRHPFSNGQFPLGLLCTREPFPDFDNMLTMLLNINEKSSSYDAIVTGAMEACLREIQGRSISQHKANKSGEVDSITLVVVERIKMLMTANPRAGISDPPRGWSETYSEDMSWHYADIYKLEHPSLLHMLLQSFSFYLNRDVRLTLTRMFLERDARVLQWQGLMERLLPLQAAIINGDAKVTEETY